MGTLGPLSKPLPVVRGYNGRDENTVYLATPLGRGLRARNSERPDSCRFARASSSRQSVYFPRDLAFTKHLRELAARTVAVESPPP